jgi:hypothetical protein
MGVLFTLVAHAWKWMGQNSDTPLKAEHDPIHSALLA